MRTFLLASASALCLATPAMAQDADGDAGLIPGAQRSEIVVTATREETPVEQIGQSVSIVTRKDIERTQAVTATDVLQRLPGVSVTRAGGFGQPSSVFIRGADNAQSLVLIDGVRINDPGDVGGGFDFGALTIGQFDRVEVVRGSSGVLWGSRAIGGVVNFITARPTADWRGAAEAEYGWRDSRRLTANAAGLLGPVGLTIGGNWLKGDGYSAFDERLGATEKDGFESKSANARAQVEIGGGLSADAGGYWTRADYGYDSYAADALHTGEKRDALGYANLRYAGLDGRLNARAGFGLTDTHRVSDDAVWGPYTTDGRVERFEAQASFAPVEQLSILLGAETENQKFRDNFGSDDKTGIDSLFANLTVRPLAGLTINGGVRHDDHEDFGTRTTLAANGALVLGEGDTAPILRASYGEGFKAPSLYQLYTNAGFGALDPETSNAWDAGVEQPFADGAGRFTLTWFDRRTKNLIDYDPVNGNYYNVGRTRARGLELGMEVVDWNGFDVNLAYTYLDATNRDTGKRLARRPQHVFTGSIDYAFAFGLKAGVELRHGSDRWDNQANTVYVAGHDVLSARATLPVGERFELFGRVENLTNERYRLVATYGTPGRSAWAGVRVRM